MLYVTPNQGRVPNRRACIESLEKRLFLDAVSSFTLVDASNGQPISGYSSIPDGATINLSQIGKSVSVRANASPLTVGSVKFGLDANANFRNENAAPYALLGNNG